MGSPSPQPPPESGPPVPEPPAKPDVVAVDCCYGVSMFQSKMKDNIIGSEFQCIGIKTQKRGVEKRNSNHDPTVDFKPTVAATIGVSYSTEAMRSRGEIPIAMKGSIQMAGRVVEPVKAETAPASGTNTTGEAPSTILGDTSRGSDMIGAFMAKSWDRYLETTLPLMSRCGETASRLTSRENMRVMGQVARRHGAYARKQTTKIGEYLMKAIE
eukprot:TRINITY_DN7401_c0_g1_i2.p1 TRINITY_DN7401_c0_g1~~TRINITY_DN7401_c0_g1_i2.p1  ORF type:complete len:213 (-),score=17.11 TRINITY_DN7401_c0_g1_i2:208-846(-)